MISIIHLVWILIMLLRFAGVIILCFGVGMFGVYFIGGNARAAHTGGGIPRSSWFGAGPRKAMRIAIFGSSMLLCAALIQLLMA
jgi:hypothetical protein